MDDDDWAGFAAISAACRGDVDVASFSLCGVVPVGRNGIDEGPVGTILVAGSHERRLAVRFSDELRGVHIGNPELDRPQASLAQPFPVPANALTTE
nr:hypothetical protein BJP76_08650 [Mycobacterium avium subsp. hominissuis]